MTPSRARTALAPVGRGLVPAAVALLVWWQLMGGPLHWNCPIRVLTHHPCPTCGLSTAARELWHLHFAAATHLNPLACVVLPFVAILGAGELASFVVTGNFGWLTKRRWVRASGLALCVGLFVVWIARFFGALGGPLAV
jgi:hypothetical protein